MSLFARTLFMNFEFEQTLNQRDIRDSDPN